MADENKHEKKDEDKGKDDSQAPGVPKAPDRGKHGK